MQKISQQKLDLELKNQLQKRLNNITVALKLFSKCSYQREQTSRPKIWEDGSTSLLDYSISDSGDPVIFIPSLINKSYIFDLSKDKSLLKYVAENGFKPFLIDWGEPQDCELSFSLEDYINKRISKIISQVYELTGKQAILVGYCMGGLLACSGAIENKDKVKGIICLATPWNFHVAEFPRIQLNSESLNKLKKIARNTDRVSADVLQSVFYYLHPQLLKQKFANLASMTIDDEVIEEIFALEYWVNDGISITKHVWKECFIDWVHYNKAFNKKWKINGKVVKPEDISVPTLFVVPKNDKIVPQTCAMPLTKLIKNSKVMQPECGHVGIIVGKNAKDSVWHPMLDWIKQL